MVKKYCTQKELQKELNITGFDIYQYARRGLLQSKTHPGLYDLEKTRKWINGFGMREKNRQCIKEKLLKELTKEESQIISRPAWNAKYGVLWHKADKRREFTMQRAIYLMVQYSTSRSDNIVYISQTPQYAKIVQTKIYQKVGEVSNGLQSLTMPQLAEQILNNEGIKTKSLTESTLVIEAIELLENNKESQKKYGYIYRQFFVEKIEKFSSDELNLLKLLLSYFGEGMFNVSLSEFNKSPKLMEWFNDLEEVYSFENKAD